MLQNVLVHPICLLFFTLVWLRNLQEIPNKVIKNSTKSLVGKTRFKAYLHQVCRHDVCCEYYNSNLLQETMKSPKCSDTRTSKSGKHTDTGKIGKTHGKPWSTWSDSVKLFEPLEETLQLLLPPAAVGLDPGKKQTAFPSTPFSLIQISWMERERWMHFELSFSLHFQQNAWQSQHLQKLQRPNTSAPWTSTTPIFKWSCFPPAFDHLPLFCSQRHGNLRLWEVPSMDLWFTM